jgi:hypothetical protein
MGRFDCSAAGEGFWRRETGLHCLTIWTSPNWLASSMQQVWLLGVQQDDQEGPACRTLSASTGRPC